MLSRRQVRRLRRVPLPPPSSGYDEGARVANLRAAPSYGSILTANHANSLFAPANGGMALAEGPVTTQSHSVSTLADAQTFMNLSGRDVTLTGDHNGTITVSTGTHNKLTLAGCTGTINLDVNGGSDTHHLYFDGLDGGTNTSINGNFTCWGAGDGELENISTDITIRGLTMQGNHSGGQNVKCHRFTLLHSSFNDSKGTLFIWPPSTNVLVVNSMLSVPKIVGVVMENPLRSNGGHMICLIDSRVRTYLADDTGTVKHGARFHASGGITQGGVAVVINSQLENGGTWNDYASDELPTAEEQSTDIVYVGNRAYTPDSGAMFSGGFLGMKYQNLDDESAQYLDVMNPAAYLVDNTFYTNDGVDGDDLFTSNVPPGTNTNNKRRTYVSTPPWDYHTTTPT